MEKGPPPGDTNTDGLGFAATMLAVTARGGHGHRIIAVKAGQTVPVWMLNGAQQPFDAQIVQRVEVEDMGKILFRVIGRHQFLGRRKVDTIVTRVTHGWAADAYVDNFGAMLAQFTYTGPHGGATHDGIVNHTDVLAADDRAHGIEFDLHMPCVG